MKNLLEKSRTLNKLLQKASGNPVEFTEMARVLGDLINANIYITGPTGKLLGYSFMDDFGCPELEKYFSSNTVVSESHNETLLRVPQTLVNIKSEKKECVLGDMAGQSCPMKGKIPPLYQSLSADTGRGRWH